MPKIQDLYWLTSLLRIVTALPMAIPVLGWNCSSVRSAEMKFLTVEEWPKMAEILDYSQPLSV